MATGPHVLHTYHADDTMNYDHNTVVTGKADLAPIIERLLREPDVATVTRARPRAAVLPVRGHGGLTVRVIRR